MVLISLTLAYYPEALLISTQQLLKAKNLYKFVEGKSGFPLRTTGSMDYETRITEYLQSLPEELLTQIKDSTNQTVQ